MNSFTGANQTGFGPIPMVGEDAWSYSQRLAQEEAISDAREAGGMTNPQTVDPEPIASELGVAIRRLPRDGDGQRFRVTVSETFDLAGRICVHDAAWERCQPAEVQRMFDDEVRHLVEVLRHPEQQS